MLYILLQLISNQSQQIMVNGCRVECVFHYIYKASINYIYKASLLIKVTVNYHVIDFYINFNFIYNVTVFIFVQIFITCKIISYYFNSKVNPLLMFNISYEK